MDEWLAIHSDNFYLDLIMLAVALIATILGIKRRKKYKSLELMFIYPLATIIQGIFIYYIEIFPTSFPEDADSKAIFCFLFVEFYSLARFYYVELRNQFRKSLILILGVVYFLWTLYAAYHYNLDNIKTLHFKFQSFAILPFVASYIIELFDSPPKANLSNEPAFWITMGSTILSLGLTPIIFSLAFIFDEDYFLKESLIYSLTFILYILSFGLLVRAHICEPDSREQ